MPASSSFWPRYDEQPILAVLCMLLFAFGVFWLGASAWRHIQESLRIGVSDQMPATLAVSAQGEAVIKNNVSTVDIGTTKMTASAAEAQALATADMNALTAALLEFGIAADDIRTSSYNVYPRYDYNRSPAVIEGYEATQTLTVKIRKSEVVNAVLGKAAELGMTNIGNLRFEADDTTLAQNEARKDALHKARAQAELIAASLGAKLGNVVNYSENLGDAYPPRLYAEDFAMEAGMGASPNVQFGQSDVHVQVYVNYAIE